MDPPSATTACSNALKSASDVTAADPTAKPFATAAVVLPSESRTSGGRWAISAMPPALSAIGPYASTETTTPAVAQPLSATTDG